MIHIMTIRHSLATGHFTNIFRNTDMEDETTELEEISVKSLGSLYVPPKLRAEPELAMTCV